MSYNGYSVGNVGINYIAGAVPIMAGSPLEHAVGNYNASVAYSAETRVVERRPAIMYSAEGALRSSLMYKLSESLLYHASNVNHIHREYMFAPDDFLKPGRAAQPFVGDAEDIEDAVKEAFEAVTGKAFPSDIRVTVLQEKEFRKHAPEPSVVGFSLNRKREALVSEVFALAAAKDRVLLTVGHEIGHVLSNPIKDKHCEEAKAFAFTRAWLKAIKENDISGLADAIVDENPAQNGLHDVAFSFVSHAMAAGKEALELYDELVSGVAEVGAVGS